MNKKKTIIILVCITIIISLILGIFESPKRLEKFISKKEISEIQVIDGLNDIVDGEEMRRKLSEGEHGQVNDLLKENKLSLVYYEEITQREPNNAYTNVESELITSHYKYDRRNKYPQKWKTIIKVSYRENADNTLTVKDGPSLTVDTKWGGRVSSSTGDYEYKHNDKMVEFNGIYDLKSETTIPIGIVRIKFPIGVKYDYGTIYVNHIVGED